MASSMKTLPQLLFTILLFSTPAFAGVILDTPGHGKSSASKESGDVWFRSAPYAWVTAFDGDVTLRGIKAPVNITFSDTLDTLDFAIMGVAEVGVDRWGIGADVIYSKSANTERLGGILFESVRVKLE